MASILITGAAGGIGAEVVRQLSAQRSAQSPTNQLYLLDISPMVRDLADTYGAVPVICDMAEPDSIAQAFSQIPQVDALVSCVGVGLWGDGIDQPLEELQKTMALNWQAPFLSLMHSVNKGMRRAVIISSTVALWPQPGMGTYSASKAALHASIRTWRYHPAIYPRPITEIMPIAVQTNLLRHHHEERLPFLVRYFMLKPETVARVIVRILGMKHPPHERIVPRYWGEFIRLMGRFSATTPLMDLWGKPHR